MERKDQRPNLLGVMIKTTKANVKTVYPIKADLWGTFGTYQSRTVDKSYRKPILPIEYGFVPALRAAEFHKVVVTERTGTSGTDYAKVVNYDGVGSTLEIYLPTMWTATMLQATNAEKLLTGVSPAEYSYANTMALSRVSLAGWEAGVDLVELPETIMFVTSPLNSMNKSMDRFTREVQSNYETGVRKSAVRFHTKQQRLFDYADSIMSTWLAGRYAVTPLVLSTLDAAETAAGKFKDLMKVYTAKGGKTVQIPMSESLQGSPLPSFWPYQVGLTQRIVEFGERKCSVVIRYRPTTVNPDIVELARWGLSPTQIPSMIYEGTPFSFMVDWVTNLGQWIQACQPKPELQILDACRTDTWKYTFDISTTKSGAGYVSNGLYKGGRGQMRRNDMKRTIITQSMTAPSLHFRSGGIRLLQSLDAAAIAGSILLPKLKPFAKVLQNSQVWERMRRQGLILWEQSLLRSLKGRLHQ